MGMDTMGMDTLGMEGCFPATKGTNFSEFFSWSVAMNFVLKFNLEFLNI